MLRVCVLFLLLTNGLYFAWSQGLLRDYGLAPADVSEPQRLTQQVQPQALRILTAAELARVEQQAKAAQAPPECWIAGPIDDAQVPALREAVEAALPSEAWSFEAVSVPARWIIYMGKYANAETLARKRSELSEMQFKTYALTNPALEFGLSLGSFPTEAAATQALARLSGRGIRTARVVLEQASVQASVLRLPAIGPALKPRLQDIKPALGAKSLRPCTASG